MDRFRDDVEHYVIQVVENLLRAGAAQIDPDRIRGAVVTRWLRVKGKVDGAMMEAANEIVEELKRERR
jgi:hypothetical protein